MSSCKNGIVNFITDYCNVSSSVIENNLDVSVFDSPYNMHPEDMIYFVKYLENKFKIQYIESDFTNYKFMNLKNIILITDKHLKEGISCKK